MHIESFTEYCISRKGVEEGFPFDEVTLVFKVMGKIFAITSLDEEIFKINLKCDPEWAIDLREEYEEIQPGFHMNKKHWNTINFEGELKEEFLLKLIDHSYNMVVKGMTKKLREELSTL